MAKRPRPAKDWEVVEASLGLHHEPWMDKRGWAPDPVDWTRTECGLTGIDMWAIASDGGRDDVTCPECIRSTVVRYKGSFADEEARKRAKVLGISLRRRPKARRASLRR